MTDNAIVIDELRYGHATVHLQGGALSESSMIGTHVAPARVARRSAPLRFLRHYLEMVLVMLAKTRKR